jgi:radical SAM protein with 4Fe4S-binding SPASM domain
MKLPTYLQLEPVGQCNLRCQMCPIQFRSDGPSNGTPAFISIELFKRIVDQFTDLSHLHLQGMGEPMLHPRFFDMVEYAVGKGLRVSINTNLTVLSPKRAARCIDSGLDCINVSIDSANAETYARIRKGSRLDRVARNFQFLQVARNAASSTKPEVRIVTVIMRRNLDELSDLVTMAHRWGCASIFVQHLCHDFQENSLPAQYRPMRQFIDEQSLLSEDRQHITAQFQAARGVAERLGIELRLPRIEVRAHPPGTPGPQRCDWPWRGAYVSYQGFAMPCCMIATPDRLNFGNLAEHSASEVWNSAQYDEFRDRLSSDDPPAVCRSCSIYKGVF